MDFCTGIDPANDRKRQSSHPVVTCLTQGKPRSKTVLLLTREFFWLFMNCAYTVQTRTPE
jgi:hypothetical protein